MDRRGAWRAWGGFAVLGIGLSLGAAASAESGDGTAVEPMAAVFDLPNPPEIRSQGGVLGATFVAQPGQITVAGQTFTANDYNRLYIPPTLRVPDHSQPHPPRPATRRRA